MKALYFKNLFQGKINPSLLIFYFGLFLLPSAFSISAFLLLISLLISSFKFKKNYFDDPWNIPFFLGGVFMILSSLVHTFLNKHLLDYNLNSSQTWIGLGNWIPFFWCFWGFERYLDTPEKRRICGLILVTGSFPVIVSGLGQSFFNWNGPFETFYGLITWYQRPIDNIFGLTGLFNNPNYAGSWLNSIWPFCLAFLINFKEDTFKKLSIFFFTLGISFCTVLTNSRAAWIGFFLGTSLIYGKKSLKFINYLFLIITFIFINVRFAIFGNNFQSFLKFIIPEPIWLEFSDFQYTRLEIWRKAFLYIFKHPIFGYGSSSFSEIFKLDTGIWKGHAHNLPLELMMSYGVPAALLVITPIILLLVFSIRKTFQKASFKNQLIFDKAWLISLVVLLSSQMVDVQYFDGRISILVWTLLSGAKNIIKDKSFIYKQNNNISSTNYS